MLKGYHSAHLSACCHQKESYSNIFEKKIDAVISTLSFSHLYNLHIQRSNFEKLGQSDLDKEIHIQSCRKCI